MLILPFVDPEFHNCANFVSGLLIHIVIIVKLRFKIVQRTFRIFVLSGLQIFFVNHLIVCLTAFDYFLTETLQSLAIEEPQKFVMLGTL